jgi:D-alanyl-D-alanine carboxypeptidase
MRWRAIILLFFFFSCKKENTPQGNGALQLRFQQIADSIRLEMEKSVEFTVPGLHLYIQGPKGSFFISSAPSFTEKITENHWHRFASVTKLFTSAAILNMAEEGWLNINDKIIAKIPGTNTSYVPGGADWEIPHKSDITIRQFMSHTAGVFDSDNDTVPALGFRYTEYKLQANPNHSFTSDEYVGVNTRYQLSYFEPGQGYHYSNVGYSILATIISRIYSLKRGLPKTYADYMNDLMIPSVASVKGKIRFPDQSTDNRIPVPGSNGMIFRGKNDTTNIIVYNPSLLVGQGNGQGTIRAVHDWVRATLRGEGPLSKATLQLMNTPFSPDYSQEAYTYGIQSFGSLGRGHSGARAGNLTVAAYQPVSDISVYGYLPMWDISNGIQTLAENNIIPMYIALDLMAEAMN